MSRENDDMMQVYAESARGRYVPPAETPDSAIKSANSNDVLDQYFSRNGSKPSENIPAQENYQPQQQQLFNEGSERRNILLAEAAANILKASPYFQSDEDKAYLKEIKEAIEEMM
jgi:hypothetical protein